MDKNEMKKAHSQQISGIIEYVPHSVVSTNIIRKSTGSISLVAVDTGEGLAGKISPFDVFIQIMEGSSEMVIEDKSILVKTGQAVIIPAHVPNSINAGGRFKMLVTVIKSGYEQEP